MIVTDVIYHGNGALYTFNDNSKAIIVPQIISIVNLKYHS